MTATVKISRRAALALAALGTVPALRAQTSFPSKPIRIIVGFAPGGANDVLARLIAEPLGQTLGQTVIVENKPGANSIVAAEFVAKAPADGYTILFGGSGPITINPAIYAKLPYDPAKDLTPIAGLGTLGLIIAARPSLAIHTVADLIRLAKNKPGGLTYSSGSASFQMAAETFALQAGIQLLHVPYRGAGPAAQALAAGEVDLLFSDAASVVPLMPTGRIRAIAVTSEPRPPGLAQVPTAAESGLPGFDFNFFIGLFAPAATPPAIVQRLYEASSAALTGAVVRERMQTMGIRPTATTPAQTAERVKRDIERYTALAKTANVKAD
jgi:tripartite-type tricarboxylate transporter receptor subunit TctC